MDFMNRQVFNVLEMRHGFGKVNQTFKIGFMSYNILLLLFLRLLFNTIILLPFFPIITQNARHEMKKKLKVNK